MKNPLLDDVFLKELNAQKEREVFAKIIALTFDENPIEEITGSVTQGSITIDGTSAVRRSCSLTVVANEINIHNYYWGLNTKFKLYVGLKNKIDDSYPEIIWFPQGFYIITSFNTSQSTNSYTIQIQGKDKMCLLNGDVGGNITANSVDFGHLTIIGDDGSQTKKDYLLKDIIYEGVHEYAKEPYHNIIINDLDEAAVELIEYRGKDPMYLIVDLSTNEVSNMTLNGSQKYFKDETGDAEISVNDSSIKYDTRIELNIDRQTLAPTIVYAEQNGVRKPHSIIKVEFGDTVGYRVTDLVYAGDFIAKVGESFTTGCLDKIKNMLGDYEYFYNLDGQFVFQKKQTFVNTSWNNLVAQEADYIPFPVTKNSYIPDYYYCKDEDSSTRFILCRDEKFNENKVYFRRVYNETYADNAATTSATVYSFENSNLITSFQNAPNFANLKNDYSIWGKRKSITGAEIPVHLRYAIDKKPVYYKAYSGVVYTSLAETPEVSQVKKKYEEEISSIQKEYNDTLELLRNYQKKPNPPGLSEEWWDVLDWANKYAIIKKEYPKEQLSRYTHSYVKGADIDLNALFPEPKIGGVYWYPYTNTDITYSGTNMASFGKWRNFNINVFDVNPDGTLGYFGHGSGCSHVYGEFLNNSTHGVTSYIYNPDIPVTDMQEFEETIALKQNDLQEELDKLTSTYVMDCEWREILYQMAVDYNRHSHDEDFLTVIARNNPDYFPKGYTGYEQYYTDILGFWRQLYDPNYSGSFKIAEVNNQRYANNPSNYYWYERGTAYTGTEAHAKKEFNDNKPYFILQQSGAYTQRKTLTFDEYQENPQHYYILKQGSGTVAYDPNKYYYTKITDEYDENGWAVAVSESPETLNFWFDFLDSEEGPEGAALAQYSVYAIGDRPKAENDDSVKSIYFRETPNVIFFDSETPQSEITDQRLQKPGYTFIRLQTNLTNLFSMSSQGKSAVDKLNNLLYNYSYCAEAITLNTLPIYHLEPNTRIFVRDDNSGINGEYIVTRLTIPLGHNGTMSISATKAVERIY